MRFFLLVFVVFLASREFIIINEELLFILSFLLFFYILFTNLSSVISVSLDNKAGEISQQMVLTSKKRLGVLLETKQAIKRGQNLLETYLNFLVFFFNRIESFVLKINTQAVTLYLQHIYFTLLVFYVAEINFKGQHLRALVSLFKRYLSYDIEHQKVFEKRTLSLKNVSSGFRIVEEFSLEANILLRTI